MYQKTENTRSFCQAKHSGKFGELNNVTLNLSILLNEIRVCLLLNGNQSRNLLCCYKNII